MGYKIKVNHRNWRDYEEYYMLDSETDEEKLIDDEEAATTFETEEAAYDAIDESFILTENDSTVYEV